MNKSFLETLQYWLRNRAHGSLQSKTVALAKSYRGGGSSAHADMAAYVASRAPATYSAVSKALSMAHQLEEAPRTLLDVGAGAGSATWAALNTWPSIEAATFFDSNPIFLELARELAVYSGRRELVSSTQIQGDIQRGDFPACHVVVASYVLAELPETTTTEIVCNLWRASQQCLVLVEPGTPAGFTRIRSAREALIRAGAAIAAPCTHANTCPIVTPDWCHFKVRLSRTREHMHAKSASVPYEDEPFSFLIAHRGQQQTDGARILAPVKLTKSAASLRLCSHEGIQELAIASRNKNAFKRVKKLNWGDFYEGVET